MKNRKLKIGNKTVAILIKGDQKIDGVKFLTPPNDPLQVGVHQYSAKKETKIHNSGLRKPVRIQKFHKFLYISAGSALVFFMNKDNKILLKKQLSCGDGIIIMNTFHKVVFFKNTNAIEIKQGPYASDT